MSLFFALLIALVGLAFSTICIAIALAVCAPAFRLFYALLDERIESSSTLAGVSAALIAPIGGLVGALTYEAALGDGATYRFAEAFVYCTLAGLVAGVPITMFFVRPI
ncbi:MAG: hypothetical protein AAF293_09360 [Pseudomonadota bacterium]